MLHTDILNSPSFKYTDFTHGIALVSLISDDIYNMQRGVIFT